jgi:hypothetical protein
MNAMAAEMRKGLVPGAPPYDCRTVVLQGQHVPLAGPRLPLISH